jgi:C4-dicarboxylate-specific signal transduction histidine kinase
MGFKELIKEYRSSIGDQSVTAEDYLEMVQEMFDLVNKLKGYVSYMSQIITTVKRQAVLLNADTTKQFSVEELVNGIKFLLNNDLKTKKYRLDLCIEVDAKTQIKGEVSNLMQVLNNLIINSFDAYEESSIPNPVITLNIREEKNSMAFFVKDCGCGISEDVKNKIFKQMVTTKGKDGNGLSLLLSYSTILGKFGGEMSFESQPGHGTTFYINIPNRK